MLQVNIYLISKRLKLQHKNTQEKSTISTFAFQRFVPFAAVASANMVNIPLMRQVSYQVQHIGQIIQGDFLNWFRPQKF